MKMTQEQIDKLKAGVKHRLDVNNVKPNTKKAQLIEFEFLQGYFFDKEIEINPAVQIRMYSGRSILTLN